MILKKIIWVNAKLNYLVVHMDKIKLEQMKTILRKQLKILKNLTKVKLLMQHIPSSFKI